MYSVTFQPIKRLTPDEMLEFAALNPELRCEMNPNGSITLKKPLRFKYKNLLEQLRGALEKWNDEHQNGVVLDDKTGYILSNGAIRLPVLSWIKNIKADSLKEHLIQFPPDFVVEYLTESENQAVLNIKMKEYIANGCALAWLIDIQNEKILIFKANSAEESIGLHEKQTGGDVLRGFEVSLQ